LDATIDRAAYDARIAMAEPAVDAPVLSWDLRAAPGYQYGIELGPVLLAGGVGMMDTKLMGTYGNPFVADRGWNTVLTFSATGTRTYTPPSAGLPMVLAAAIV